MYVGLSETDPLTDSHNYGTTNPHATQDDKLENQGPKKSVKELAGKFSVSFNLANTVCNIQCEIFMYVATLNNI